MTTSDVCCHDLDLLESRDVIGHVIVILATCCFLLVVNYNHICLSCIFIGVTTLTFCGHVTSSVTSFAVCVTLYGRGWNECHFLTQPVYVVYTVGVQVFATVSELIKFYENNGVELLGDSRRNLPVGKVKLRPIWSLHIRKHLLCGRPPNRPHYASRPSVCPSFRPSVCLPVLYGILTRKRKIHRETKIGAVAVMPIFSAKGRRSEGVGTAALYVDNGPIHYVLVSPCLTSVNCINVRTFFNHCNVSVDYCHLHGCNKS